MHTPERRSKSLMFTQSAHTTAYTAAAAAAAVNYNVLTMTRRGF